MKVDMNKIKKKKKMKIKYLLSCFGLWGGRMKFLKKNNVFAELGENVTFQPIKLPNEPKCIKIHNNVRIAADVTFYGHDIINHVFSTMDGIEYQTHGTCIEIHDNVFIGGHSVIVGSVSIGPNAIVGAGSVVTKDVMPGTIVAGNPARVIGTFDELHEKRKQQDGNVPWRDVNERAEELWVQYYKNKQDRENKHKIL